MSPKRRRGPGEGSIKRVALKSGKVAYRAWLTVGYRINDAGTRTPIRRTVQHARRQVVIERLDQLRAKYRADLDLAAEVEMRLSTLFEKWLAHYVATSAPKKRTPETYQWAITRALRQLGDPLVARVTPMLLQTGLTSLAAELKPASLNLIRVVCDGAFGQAVLWRIRPDNPAADLKLPKERDAAPAPRRVLTSDEALRYLVALQAERLGLAVALTYAVGIRPGEAAALRVADIDLDAGTITIAATHNVVAGRVEREPPKSRRGARVLPVPPALIPWVRQQLARIRNERTAMAHQWTAPDEGLLFVRETDGGRLSHRQIYPVARRIAERAGLGVVGPRVLRRSMLSLLASGGVDPKVRAAIGGHTPGVTEKHYTEHQIDPAAVTAAMGQLAAILAPLADAPEEGSR